MHFHWLEPASGGLHECLCTEIANDTGPAPQSACWALKSTLFDQARPDERLGFRLGSYSVDGGDDGEGTKVFAEPRAGVPPLAARIPPGAVVEVLETTSHGLWFRHAAGWSVAGDRTRASRSLADELVEDLGVDALVQSSNNGYENLPESPPDWHLLMHMPSEDVSRKALELIRTAFGEDRGLRTVDRLVFPAAVPHKLQLVGADRLIWRLARAHLLHSPGRRRASAAGASAPAVNEGDGEMDGEMSVGQIDQEMSVRELRASLSALGAPAGLIEGCLEKYELRELLISLRESTQRRAAAEEDAAEATAAVRGLLVGMHVPVACGCPAGLSISTVETTTTMPGRDASWGANFAIPSSGGRMVRLDALTCSQYEWEWDSLSRNDGGATAMQLLVYSHLVS